LRLGWLLGERFLLLTHQGRKSGRWHETVIEVVGKKPGNVYSVVAAWAEKADWWQNLKVNPNCYVNIERKHFEAKARTLNNQDAEEMMLGYAHQHPKAMKAIAGFLGFNVDGSDEQYRQIANQVPIVEFIPTG